MLLFCLGLARADLDLRIFDGTGTAPAPDEEAPEPGDAPGDSGDDADGGEPGEPSASDGERADPMDGNGEQEEDGEPWMPASTGGPETEEEAEPGEAEGMEDGEEGTEEEPNGGEEEGAGNEVETEPDPSGPVPGGRATEVFRPTERIPADQAVDFPWDI